MRAQPCYFALFNEEQMRLAHDVMDNKVDTCATPAGLVHDDKDTDCQTQHGSAHGRESQTFGEVSSGGGHNKLTSENLFQRKAREMILSQSRHT